MLIVFIITFVIQIVICECFSTLFKTVSLGVDVWFKTILTAFSVVVVSEIYKALYKLITKSKNTSKKLVKSFN